MHDATHDTTHGDTLTDGDDVTVESGPNNLVGLREYCEIHNVHERTVKRWLANEELQPTPYRDENGHWLIPRDAKRVPRPAGPRTITAGYGGPVPGSNGHDVVPAYPGQQHGQLVAPFAPHAEVQRTLDELVEDLPTMLPLHRAVAVINHGLDDDEAAVTEHGLRANAEYFGLVKVGKNGKYLMPLATVKKLRGMTP